MSRSLTTQSPTTSNTVPVVSNTGFSAGDLVYQKNGAVDVIPDGLVATGNFNINSNVNITAGATNSNVLSATGVGPSGGSQFFGPVAAKLSNGNVVVAYVAYVGSYYAYFRIFDENNTEVVAPTRIPVFTANSSQNICVCALPAGGFALAFNDSSSALVYAVYTNTGAVTLAPTQDVTVSVQSMVIAPRGSGNGFIFVTNDSTNLQTRFKVFSDAGTQTIAWTNVVGYNSSQQRPAVAVRSDNSFVVGTRTSASAYRYYVYSSTGTAGVNGTVNSTYTTIGSPHFSMTAMTTGTNVDMVYFVFNEATSNYIIRQTLSATNVLGTETVVTISYTSSIQALSNGGYAIAYQDGNNLGMLALSVYNSANTPLATTTVNGIAINISNFYNYTSIVELASNYLVAGSYAYAQTQSPTTVMAQINKTTYAVRSFNAPSLTVGASSASVNTYAKSASNPNAAYFLASSSGTLSKTISSGAVAYPGYVQSTTVNFIHNRVMQNGDIVVVYSDSIGVKFNVYNSYGTFLNTYTVTTSITNTFPKACVLFDGTLVIVVPASNNFTYTRYSTSYAVLGTASHQTLFPSYTPNSPNSISAGYDVAPLANNRFVVGYRAGSFSTYSVISNSLTAVDSSSISNSQINNASVSSMPNGGFTISAQNDNGSRQAWMYTLAESGNTYVQQTQAGSLVGDSWPNSGWLSSASTAQGFSAIIGYSNSTSNVYQWDASTSTTFILFNVRQGYTGTVGLSTMPNGQVVSVYLDAPGASYIARFHAMNSSATNVTNSLSLSLPGTGSANSTPYVCVSPIFDNVFVLTFMDSANKGAVAIYNMVSKTYSSPITAGVTVQNAVGYTPSQSNGYIFKGVAATSALPGGTGLVQNVGAAQLNTNYPAGTTYQAFDSTGTLVTGTKGTIVGRNVNMTGNS